VLLNVMGEGDVNAETETTAGVVGGGSGGS
jgi:hypothetical protein